MNTKKRKVDEVSGDVEYGPAKRGRRWGTVEDLLKFLEASKTMILKKSISKSSRYQGSFYREPITL